jgi:alkylation response protein AidB-like acyl-CoA dehydrogenase
VELEFTPEQEELRDGVRTVLSRECPMSLVRAVVEDGAPAAGLWAQMVELGWPALTIAEGFGGLGFGAVELAVVVEELGRVVAPGPFLPTVTQFAPVVQELGTTDQQHRFLAPILHGDLIGALAITEPGAGIDLSSVRTTATQTEGGWRLDGRKTGVLGAAEADEIAVVARVGEGTFGVAAFVIPSDALAIEPVTAFDGTRSLANVVLESVSVSSDRLLGDPGASSANGLRRAIEEAMVSLALETVGTCQTIFDVTLEYAKQREQFGVPIGSFQAIKHKLADMLVALERARATGYFAALAIAEDDGRRAAAASTARIAAGDCQRLLAGEGIQIHGGIGYTWEHDMHLYVRRVKTNAQLLGTEAEQRARLADLLLG